MKKICFYAFCSLFLFGAQNSLAQTTDGVDSFKQDKDSWRRKEEQVSQDTKKEIVQKIKDTVSVHALNNITDAEQIFCYTVEKASKEYSGYTLDGMAITGFCGMLGQNDKDIFIGEFLQKDESTSNVVAKCMIEPKIMLRFVKGVDYTDVLLSSPCHSFSIFYGGKVKPFNAEPSANIINAFVTVYDKQKVDFVSPALLNQVMPIGVAQTQEQKAILKEKQGNATVRKWDTQAPAQQPTQEKSAVKKGWNRLKR